MVQSARIFKYPLENQDEYAGKILFYLVDEESERSIGPGVFDNLAGGLGRAGLKLGKGVVDIGAALAKNGIEPKSARVGFYGRGNDSKGYTRASEPKYLPNQKISLFLPQAIQIADGATYDTNVELGAVGGGIERGLMSGANLGSTIANATTQSMKAVEGILGGNVNLSSTQAALAASKVAAKVPFVGGEGAASAVASATGVTANPNSRTLFKSVPIRQFSFSFTLIPTSAREAEQVRNIIKFFRTELYPEVLNAAGLDYGYKFPNRFLIKMQYKNTDIPGVKFLPAYLQSFTTNYNPNGMGMHSDGSWAEAQISLSFTEGKALARQDIVEGGY
jgi:hypothetical protein